LDKSQIVLDIISSWFEEVDAAYLAKEDQVVYLDDFTQKDWIKLTSAECVRLMKATRLNPSLMEYCTSSLIMAAAQELGRVYVKGVNVKGECNSQFFNFSISQYKSHKHITRVVLSEVAKGGKTIAKSDVVGLLALGEKYFGLPPLKAHQRNLLLSVACKEFNLRHRYGSAGRYSFDGKPHACIQVKGYVGVEEFTDEQREKLIVEIQNLGD